jgi:hypothetical protein
MGTLKNIGWGNGGFGVITQFKVKVDDRKKLEN